MYSYIITGYVHGWMFTSLAHSHTYDLKQNSDVNTIQININILNIDTPYILIKCNFTNSHLY